MITSREFYESLQHEEEYFSCLMTSEVMAMLPKQVTDNIAVTQVKQMNESFKEDDIHKSLVREVAKAKSELTKYEFNKNHGGS